MDVLNQIKDAGLEPLNGRHRLIAALSIGQTVTAIDTEGRTLEIAIADGRVVANIVASSASVNSSGILVRKIGEAFSIAASAITNNPANPRV